MIDFIRFMFLTPGSSNNAYEWGSAFGTHAGFGVCAFAILSAFMTPKYATIVPTFLYLFFWEGAQVVVFGTAILEDSALDFIAFTFGALLGYAIWQHEVDRVRLFLFGLITVAIIEMKKRDRL